MLATFGTFARIARPHERSAVLALANVIAYLGNSMPAVLGGITVTALGLGTATEIYALAIAAIAFLALALRLNQARPRHRAAQPSGSGEPSASSFDRAVTRAPHEADRPFRRT